MDNVTHWLGGSVIQWACSVAVGLPFVVVAVRATRQRRRDVSVRGLVLLAVFFFVSLALTRLEPVWTFIKSPWQAMILMVRQWYGPLKPCSNSLMKAHYPYW